MIMPGRAEAALRGVLVGEATWSGWGGTSCQPSIVSTSRPSQSSVNSMQA